MPWAGCVDCERIVVKSAVHTIKSRALRALDMMVSREAKEVALALIYKPGHGAALDLRRGHRNGVLPLA